MPLPRNIEKAFQATLIDLPKRGHATVGPAIGVARGTVDRTGYVITAHNPYGQPRGPAYNAGANDQLRRLLELRGVTFEEATGRSPDGSHREDGFFVETDETDALAVGASFGQLAIFKITSQAVQVLECSPPSDLLSGGANDSELIFTVTRFAPARCPGCLAVFAGPDDFVLWAATESAGSFGEALGRQPKLFPELFRPRDDGSFANPQRADFIACVHCDNKTLRVKLAERIVDALADAERLIAAEGFTSYTRGLRLGDAGARASDS